MALLARQIGRSRVRLSFEAADRLPQPDPKRLLNLLLRPRAVQVIQSLTVG